MEALNMCLFSNLQLTVNIGNTRLSQGEGQTVFTYLRMPVCSLGA